MKPWLRPLPFALGFAYLAARAERASVDDAAPSRSAALCGALAKEEGVSCAPDDVVWLDGPNGLRGAMHDDGARALVRGKDKEDAIDLWKIETRLSPEGQLLDIGNAFNLTHSTGADEGLPVYRESFVAYVVLVDGRPEAVHVLDLAGHDTKAYEELSRMQRTQVKLADLQTTGSARGVKKTVYALVPAPTKAELAFRHDGMLEVKTDARSIVIDPAHGSVIDGVAHVRVTTEVVAKPPTFAPWMSDRLRAVSWFGDEKNQIFKAVVFTAMEWVKGQKAKLTGDTGEQETKDDLGELQGNQIPQASFIDPEIGWPPRPLEPLASIKPAVPGEGQWITLDKDAFITPIPGLASPFVTTFVRTDPSATHTRVYVTLWDPRLVALHMEAGTVEPVSATGEAGPGQIPRTPEVVRRVIAGFNGGFQATHGQFGMQANGVLYLPPKAYAATVMEMRDGTTTFGAWPKNPKEASAADVPDEVLSFRQNMTALVQGDKYNPWGRAWWGGVPPGWHDRVHTTRSGLCITKEGFVAYFWGNEIEPETLGRAMSIARCAFGIHLDMNPGLAGFEFYNVQPAQTFQPLGRPLQVDWEYEGTFKDMPEFKFRSRRMIKSMGHILFPRYVQRDARDFFYLTARSVLPGPPIDKDSPWRTKGLPQHGFPYAVAITSLELPNKKRVRVLRVDPRTVRVDTTPEGTNEEKLVATFGRPRSLREAGAPKPPEKGDKKLFLGGHVFSIAKSPTPGAVPLAELAAHGADARAAVGISDEDGMLQWIELLPDDKPDPQTSDEMMKVLERIGCSARGLVTSDVRAYLGGAMDIGAEPAAPAQVTMRLVRTPAPAAKLAFESTEIVPQSVWQPLQSQKVKWRPTLAPPDKSATPAGSGSAKPPPNPPK
jgi:hypothetical protein